MTPAPTSRVPSVDKAAAILGLLADAGVPLKLAEIASSLDLPKSTTLGICSTLVGYEILQRMPDDSYRPGVQLLRFASTYLRNSPVHAHFEAALDAVLPHPRGTMVLGILRDEKVIYLARRVGASPVGISHVGVALPAWTTAAGRALLSTLPRDEVSRLYRAHPPVRSTGRSDLQLDHLLERLDAIAQSGVALDDEETVEGVVALAAPVRQQGVAGAVAAVAMSATGTVADEHFRSEASVEVQNVASAIEKRLATL